MARTAEPLHASATQAAALVHPEPSGQLTTHTAAHVPSADRSALRAGGLPAQGFACGGVLADLVAQAAGAVAAVFAGDDRTPRRRR